MTVDLIPSVAATSSPGSWACDAEEFTTLDDCNSSLHTLEPLEFASWSLLPWLSGLLAVRLVSCPLVVCSPLPVAARDFVFRNPMLRTRGDKASVIRSDSLCDRGSE